MNEDDEPGNVFSGVGMGIYGGAHEIITGITGVFTNPWRQAKADGFFGFIKGLGQGLLGAVVAPFAAVFRIGTSILTGLKNTATMFQTSKLATLRFRHPRIIEKNKPLTAYNEQLAEVMEIIERIKPKENYLLIFSADFMDERKEFEGKVSTIILTDRNVMVVTDGKELVMEEEYKDIVTMEVFTMDREMFVLLFNRDEKEKYILTENLQVCTETYKIINNII